LDHTNTCWANEIKMKLYSKIKNTILLIFIIFSISLPAVMKELEITLPILPDDLFSRDSVPDPCPDYESPKPNRYMIFWNDSPSIDGSFILVIHPKQIFLRSSHDNPNPNKIYWFSSISTEQYKEISHFLGKYNGKVFSNKGVWSWGGYKVFELTEAKESPYLTGDEKDSDYKKADLAIISNIFRIFAELNHGLPANVNKFKIVEGEISLLHGVYIGEKPVKIYVK
jgi:hypothetical protein